MDQYSPKSSPSRQVGSRSPNVSAQQVDPTGLKMTISLKQKTPFYLMKPEQIPSNETTGATNLMAARGLEHSYHKLTTKKMKDSLSSFLPQLPGIIDTPGGQDNSALRGIIEKPPVCGKELLPLNQLQLSGFRLHPGPLPEQYRGLTQAHTKRKKHKKHKRGGSGSGFSGFGEGDAQVQDGGVGAGGSGGGGSGGGSGGGGGMGGEGGSRGDEERERRREKKHKRHEKDADEKKKKKKKEKRKKNREDKDM